MSSPGVYPPPPPRWSDKRLQVWIYAIFGLLGFTHQLVVAESAQPAILTFCGFLCGAPIAGRLWESRKGPE